MSKLICIDAGHGGTDPGACGNGLKEKDITLKLAKKVGRLMKAQGTEIVYTRTNDSFVALGERCRIANSKDADLFISLHINSATNTDAEGIETLCYTKNNLAFYIQQNLINELKLTDRGVKERKELYVLNSTYMEAVLVELGFISNKNDSELLKTDSFLDRAAVCTAQGICKRLGIEYKEVKKEMKAEEVKRKYKYNGKTVEFNVLSAEGKNYVSVRDIAGLLNKKITYDSTSKLTEIWD